MTFQLRREEVLDGDQLKFMLEESPARAAQAILIAAREGVIDAQALLGQILLDGRGIAQDQPLAVRWFEIAAQRGHLMARNMLGRCHEHGWGCAADASLAAAQYRVAAEAGLDWAMYNYANLLATGRGVAQDHVQALMFYRRAAELGHAKSMNLVGRYLEQGTHCSADPITAFAWYRQSALGGDFRGQFSYASVLLEHAHLDQALMFFRAALQVDHGAFLRQGSIALMKISHPEIRAVAEEFASKAELLGS